jgi:hypothetical protein
MLPPTTKRVWRSTYPLREKWERDVAAYLAPRLSKAHNADYNITDPLLTKWYVPRCETLPEF